MENEKLTDEQIHVLEWLKKLLNEMQAEDLDTFWVQRGCCFCHAISCGINAELERVELPTIDLPDIDNERGFFLDNPKLAIMKEDTMYYEYADEAKKSAQYKKAHKENRESAEIALRQIENYLAQIDKDYEECFAPHGLYYYIDREGDEMDEKDKNESTESTIEIAIDTEDIEVDEFE